MRRFLIMAALRVNLENILSLGYKSDMPQKQLAVGYALYAALGAFLLSLPFASVSGISIVDHLFNAMSALSTTGLTSVDVSVNYTFAGQMIILLLIQIGGLGYMTLSSFIMLGITRHLGSAKNNIFTSQFSLPDSMCGQSMVRNIVKFTFFFEALGIVLLYPYFLFHDVESPLWSAVFHTISAFCTAGFSIYTDNLMRFRDDIYVNIVIMMLCYMGAMGFIMMTDIVKKFRDRRYRITFTTKIIIRITCALSMISTLHLYYCEPSLQQYEWGKRFMIAMFHSVSAMTTAGYNTVDLSHLVPISMFVMSFTMYIGASPSGTGGGLKSTTLSAIYAYTKNKLGYRGDISLMNNLIPSYRVETALTTFVLYTFVLFSGIYLITMFEPDSADIMKIVFEASSALATTGLTSGILTMITVESKIILILLMFIGRVGVISLGNALLIRSHEQKRMMNDDLAV